MIEHRTEGFVLRSQDYQETDRLITLFTQTSGLLHLIVKKIPRSRPDLLALSSLFSRGEYLYFPGKGELAKFRSGHLIDGHLELRLSFSSLEAGGKLALMILNSQLPGKPAPALYALLIAHFKQLTGFENHHLLLASFALKLLYHEGLISLVGELQLGPYPFSEQEKEMIKILVENRSFKALKELKIPIDLLKKILTLKDLMRL